MITIDRVTRQMKIPDKEKILGVVSDEDSHTLYFTCASILDQNFDLTTANIYINYRRSDGEIGQYMVTDKSVVKGTCTFSWLVSRAAYTQKGTVDFIVCMKIVDEDGIVQKEWNTTLGHLTVLEGLEPEGEIPIPPADTDLISQLMNQVNTTVNQAEADINSTKTSAIEALDQKVTEISDAIDDKIADLNTLGVIRPNLLINSDFKSGIINQRGESSYTGKTNAITYTIDRWWISKSATVTLSVNSGYISVSLPTLQSVGQFIEFEPNGEMTLAIKLKDEDLKVITVDNWAAYEGYIAYVFEIETNVTARLAKFESDDKWLLFIYNGLESTKTLNIEYIKLEKGSIYTGMPQWDETTELMKCYRYYYRLPASDSASIMLPLFYRLSDTSAKCSIQVPIAMVKTPSITHNDIWLALDVDGVWKGVESINSSRICGTIINFVANLGGEYTFSKNSNVGYIIINANTNGYIDFDAERY